MTGEPFVLNRPDGSALTFKRCSPADRIKFRGILRAYRKVARAHSLNVLDITGKAALPYLDEIDARRLRESEVVEWVNHPEGQREAILLSLQIDNPKATLDDVDALGLDDDEMLRVAAGVFNLIVASAQPEGGPPASPLPEAPVAGQTGTGGGTPTESDAASAPAPTTPSAGPSTPSSQP